VSAGFPGLVPCVHCGFCLQSCPTYLATGDEADGPRGRIVLMQSLARGSLGPDDADLRLHLDRCLGCRACEPVCPSGVRYGASLEAARARIADRRGVPVAARLVLAVFAQPALRRPLLFVARLLRRLVVPFAGGGRLGFVCGMTAATRPGHWARHDPGSAASRVFPPARGAAAPFLGCVQRELFGHVHDATRRTLAANRIATVPVEGQGCCGALHAHAGLHAEAVRLARENVRAFASRPEAPIVVNAAGCGAMLRSYADLLPDDPSAVAFAARVRDVTEVLADAGPRRGASLPLRVAYDPPCHLQHAQGIVDPPLVVLAAVPSLEVVVHAGAEHCCGSAGIYSLLQPELSRVVLAGKIASLREAAPDCVATGNPGCAMQIGAGMAAAHLRVPTVHPVELLDRSYALAGYYTPDLEGRLPA